MSPTPLLTISIVSFNTKEQLIDCISSLLHAIGGISAEVVVVDNASKDGSADAVAQRFPQVTLIRNAINLGFGGANNIAYSHTSSKYFVLVNPDAQLAQDALKLALEHMEANPKIAMGGGRLTAPDGSWQPSARLFPSLLHKFLEITALEQRYPSSAFFGRYNRTWSNHDLPCQVDWIPGAFSIIRRLALNDTLPFDPRFFLYCEEVDLCKRIKDSGYEIWYWPDVRIAHIGGESSKTITKKSLSSGKQLRLWQMYSDFLYFRKHHGGIYTYSIYYLEMGWLKIRQLKQRLSRNSGQVKELAEEIALLRRAWKETSGGRVSPVQPWSLL